MASIPAGPRVMALRAAGLLAAGAALACVVGDLALQYTASRGDLLTAAYRYFTGIPEWRLLLGYYLGVLALPIQLTGVWLMYYALVPAGRRLALLVSVLGAYTVAVGPGLHSMAAILALLAQARMSAVPNSGTAAALNSMLQRADSFVIPLGAIILASMLLTYLGYAAIVGF